MIRRTEAPLYNALLAHWMKGPRSFHVPGHRFGSGISSQWRPYLENVMRLDLTELSDTDNLHQAEGVIREAQQLASACFGADETHFLVGGSTAGNLALLLTVCEPGDRILVQRNVHRSVIHGLTLAGASAVFLAPETEAATGLATVPELETVEEALNRYPNAKAVLLTNPNYYGMSADLADYARLIHARGIPLLVDEAHGAHYGLHPALPTSAMSQGADAAVQSTHKTLAALTMGAMLHVRGDLLDRDKLRRSLAMIQSSSPSYPIMASLDIARAMLDEQGPKLFAPALREADRFRMHAANRLPVFELVHTGLSGRIRMDPLRIVLRTNGEVLSGYKLLGELEERGIWGEMADSVHTVLLFGLGMAPDDTDALVEALADISERYRLNATAAAASGSLRRPHREDMPKVSEPVQLSRRMPGMDELEAVPLAAAGGRRAAEAITPYPPGIPELYPGERITSAVVDRLSAMSAAGAECRGAADPKLGTILVYRETDRPRNGD